ncbi:hypothetical protein Micbo1qcDRAFT_176604 [Microdochium bolleyi]|uniref:Mid2 domain-containing protein n=1 Tax=Microdochium bolleyi TaxID=196109 RepID=A0A136IYN0_9PEZI|nr:hypothetical protein Micbo1qcDRAFT_176604 [Microdochium bolleyi]
MAKCFDITGKANANFKPCLSLNGASPCCGQTDLCMDNGLCLNAGGNQAYTIQGCTDTNWNAPCRPICKQGDLNDTMGMYYVQYCWDTDPGSESKTQWCCGKDCCKNALVNKVKLDVAKQLYHPGEASIAAFITATTTLTAAAAPATGNAFAPGGSVSQDEHRQMMIKLSAGLGVPLGILALFSLFAVFFWYSRARHWRGNSAGRSETTIVGGDGGAAISTPGTGYADRQASDASPSKPFNMATTWPASRPGSNQLYRPSVVSNPTSQPMVDVSPTSPGSAELDNNMVHQLHGYETAEQQRHYYNGASYPS